MKSFLIALLLGGAPLLAEDAQPNIVFILADDQGYGDLSCYGSTVIKTPNIDSICHDGIKFESFYVHNRCSPTRAALMTGCHAQRVGIDNVIGYKDRKGLNSEEITIPELLKTTGYTTCLIGKWHIGEWPQFNPTLHGFDYFYGRFTDQDGNESLFENKEKVGEWGDRVDRYCSKKLLPKAIEFMRNNSKRPFFLYYASNIPHSKWLPLPDLEGKSDQGSYGDCVQQLDWEVGELLKELDSLGLTKNTLVVYSSDNGPQLNAKGHGSAGPLRDGKWSNFEGGIRVPCLMRWPQKIPAGTVNSEIVGIIDMLPTFCAMTGVAVPTDRVIDGKNILPYMQKFPVKQSLHEIFVVPGSVIRHEGWKLLARTERPGGGLKNGKQDRVPAKAGSLFNLAEDIGETKDVSAEYPGKAAELQKMMTCYMNVLEGKIRPAGTVVAD